ncbi:MAG: hypothetical protein ABIV92_07960 [Thermoflexales bacterium]
MRIAGRYSHYNGLEFMLMRQPRLWRKLENLIASVDANSDVSLVRGKPTGYSYQRLCRIFRERLSGLSWRERLTPYWSTADPQLLRDICHLPAPKQKRAILDAGAIPMPGHANSGLINERVAVIPPFEPRVVKDWIIDAQLMPAYFRDEIDVGIQILPMKSMLEDTSSGIRCYEDEIYNVLRNGRGVPAVPLVVLGIAP